MSISFICHCHSEYSEVWPIYFDYLFKNSKTFKKAICVNNKNVIEDFFKTRDYKYDKLIEYDESIAFAQRMIYIYSQIDTKYVIYLGDNIVINNLDESKILNIAYWLDINELDSVQFHIKKNDNNLIKITDYINVYQILDSEYPFSFIPSIWNRNSILNAYKSVPNACYRWFEIDIMNYMIQNCKIFRLKDIGQNLINGWDCTMEPWFTFLHIIHQRKWCDKSYFISDYFKNEYDNIINKYNINFDNLGIRTNS